MSSSAIASTVAPHALVLGRQEPQHRHQQHRGIERRRPVLLGEHAPLVDCVIADVAAGSRPRPRPTSQRAPAPRAAAPGARRDRAATQHITFDDVKWLWLAADLPDPAVGLAPMGERLLDLAHEDRPQPFVEAVARGVEVHRIEDRAPDVVLALLVGGIADADGPGALVARAGGRAPAPRASFSPPIAVHHLERSVPPAISAMK